MDDQQLLYRARAQAAGGHPGEVRTEDGALHARLSVPQALGGQGGAGTNPEQLLAAAYAACFYSALEQAASERRVALPRDLSVDCEVALGRRSGGFELEVQVAARGGHGELDALVQRARELWPHAPGVAPQVRVRLGSAVA